MKEVSKLKNIIKNSNINMILKENHYKKILASYNSKKITLYENACEDLERKSISNAIKKFKKLYEESPSNELFQLGYCLCNILSDNLENLEELEKKLDILKNQCFRKYLLGLYYETQGYYQKSIELYTKSLDEDENFVPAMFKLAYNKDLRGYEEEAIKLYERCLKFKPGWINVLINLGILYEDVHQYDKAVECYRKILTINPKHKRAKLFLKDAVSSTNMYVDEEKERQQDKQNQILSTPITEFELSVRSRNCLNKMDIKTLGNLVMKSEAELLSYKNFGETSLAEIKEILSKKGLKLGMGAESDNASKKKEKKTNKNLKNSNNEEVLATPISALELSVRSRKCLNGLKIKTVSQLVQKTEPELLSCKNFGQTSLKEIRQKLGELGVSIKEG